MGGGGVIHNRKRLIASFFPVSEMKCGGGGADVGLDDGPYVCPKHLYV